MDRVELQILIALLDEEQYRVKQWLNENSFDCTTATSVIARRYRNELKAQIKVLQMNLED